MTLDSFEIAEDGTARVQIKRQAPAAVWPIGGKRSLETPSPTTPHKCAGYSNRVFASGICGNSRVGKSLPTPAPDGYAPTVALRFINKKSVEML